MRVCEKCGNEHDGTFGSGRFCNRSCANSRNFSEESRKKKSLAVTWSKKLREANARQRKPRINKACPVCESAFSLHRSLQNQIYCSRKCYYADKEGRYRKKTQTGGYRRGSSRGKCGWYKGIWCDSSYELAWVVHCLETGVAFKRSLQGFPYTFRGKARKYYPDFYLEKEETYVEIKGFSTKKFEAKLSAFPLPIIVLYEENLRIQLEYARKKYGKKFWERLYGSKPSKQNQCLICDSPAKNKYCSRICSGKAAAQRRYGRKT